MKWPGLQIVSRQIRHCWDRLEIDLDRLGIIVREKKNYFVELKLLSCWLLRSNYKVEFEVSHRHGWDEATQLQFHLHKLRNIVYIIYYCIFLWYLINKRHGSWMLKLTASRPNHTSYRKVYFNEFVQNYWGCDMGMIIFDLHAGC